MRECRPAIKAHSSHSGQEPPTRPRRFGTSVHDDDDDDDDDDDVSRD